MEENELVSICSISDEKLDKLFVETVRIENESSMLKNDPVQKWNDEKHLPYIDYPDGHREYV